MDKTISVGGKDVKFRATARTPRLYRAIVGRDMIADMAKLEKTFKNIEKGEERGFDLVDLQIFEDTAYIMARHADPDIEQKTADEWLDTFDMFSIYEVLPEILQLWAINTKQTSTPKKK